MVRNLVNRLVQEDVKIVYPTERGAKNVFSRIKNHIRENPQIADDVLLHENSVSLWFEGRPSAEKVILREGRVIKSVTNIRHSPP